MARAGNAGPEEEDPMTPAITEMAHDARNTLQSAMVFALCIGASMILPLTLAIIGFQAL
jgi:hypothetical protein